MFPGCDRPPGWCQAHHIIWWTKDGPTDLDNLALLCSHHHHLVHEGGYRLHRGEDDALRFVFPDGSPVTAPALAA
ncbi:MAG: HNH endonuclease signature motif containing protein [Acidimicrobiales bacterium]